MNEQDSSQGNAAESTTPVAKLIDRANEVIGKAASWLLLAMTIVLAAIIILARFRTGFVWLQDLLIFMHGIAFMTASAYTLLHDGHVRIDIFYSRLDQRGKAIVNAIGVLIFLLPSCGTILYFSFDYVLESWKVFEAAQVAGGVPATFMLKTFILVYVVLMVAQGLSLLLKSLSVIGNASDSKSSGSEA